MLVPPACSLIQKDGRWSSSLSLSPILILRYQVRPLLPFSSSYQASPPRPELCSMAYATIVPDDSENTAPSPPQNLPSYIYLGLYDFMTDTDASVGEWPPERLSWRLIPSLSATAPVQGHQIFGIHHDDNSTVSPDNEFLDDPMESIRAFIRLPVQITKSYDALFHQIQTLSQNYIVDAVDDGWQEWEWVYNVFETLEVLEFLDDRITNDWQYNNKPKMEIFKEKILKLAKEVHDRDGPPETRVIDFPFSP